MKKIKDMTREEKAEYYRLKTKEWRLKNPARNIELRKKYKESEKGKNAIKRYQRKDPEKRLEYHRNRYEKNPEKYKVDKEYMKIYMRSYFSTKEKRQKYLQRQRDNYNFRIGQIKKSECDRCGNKENLEIHHIDYKDNQNIIILCRKCHRAIHRIELNTGGNKQWQQ